MERIGAWLWRAHRQQLFAWVSGVSGAFVVMTVMLPALVVSSVFLHLQLDETLVWGASVGVGFAVPFSLTMVSLRGRLEPVRRWVAGDQSDPAAVWSALLRLPQDAASRTIPTVLPFNAVTTFPLVLAMADRNEQSATAVGVGYVLVTVTCTLLTAAVAQTLLRPAIADIGRHLGAVTVIERGAGTLRWRLLIVLFVSIWLAGVVLSAAVLGTSATGSDHLIAVAGGVVWAGYFSWVFETGLLRSTLRPLDDVIEATGRVRRGDVHTPVPVSSFDELGDLAAAFNEMQRGLAERESLHAAFGSYVDPALAQRLIESGSSVFEGEELSLTVLFADVRDFTSYSEGVEPVEAVELLNRLFDVAVPVLHEHGGHANHYLGDGMLAVFGAPQPLDHHADAAVAAAIDMQQRVREEFGTELRLGIGINSGLVIAGTVGGGGRHEFTVIGDTVNVASRVEQLTKETGDVILITEATRAALSSPKPRSTKRGGFDLKGKSARVTVYAVNPFPRSTR